MLRLPIPPAQLLTPMWLHFRSILGPFLDKCFEVFFKLFVKCETHTNNSIYYVLATSEMLETSLFGPHWRSFFFSFLEPRFGKALGTHFDDFGSLLGSQSVLKGRCKFLGSGPSVACSRVFVITEGTFFTRGDFFGPYSLPIITFRPHLGALLCNFGPAWKRQGPKHNPKESRNGSAGYAVNVLGEGPTLSNAQ